MFYKITFLFFYLKDFKFDKYICNMYNLADIKRNCRKSRFIKEQRRLLNKTKKKIGFFNEKDFIFYKYISKCIFWQI